MLQSCSQKLSVSESPTAPSASARADSTSAAGTGKRKAVSGVIPLIPSYQQGAIAYGGTEWFLVNWVPATSHNGTYTMLEAGSYTSDQLAELHNHYGFTRIICTPGSWADYVNAGFAQNQIILLIGYQGLDLNWQDEILNYGPPAPVRFLGFMVDEPSGFVTGATMQKVAQEVHSYGDQLWLDDYDTGVISDVLYFAAHNYHLADVPMLDNADYTMCDADNSENLDGMAGIGCYVGQDYDEFLNWFSGTPKFNTIFVMPTYSERNVQTVVDWITNGHIGTPITNFALYLPSGWSWAEVDGFAQYAYQAGFIGQYQLLEQAKYVCLQNNVTFVPTSSDVEGTYYGVLNNGVYTGPVDPSTSGATACWSIQTWVSQNQYQTVYAY